MADAEDSKSSEGNLVWVRIPPPAPKTPAYNFLRNRRGGVYPLPSVRAHSWRSASIGSSAAALAALFVELWRALRDPPTKGES